MALFYDNIWGLFSLMALPIYHFPSMRTYSSPNLLHIEIIWREGHHERRTGWDLALDGESLDLHFLLPCLQACLYYNGITKPFSSPSHLFYHLHNAKNSVTLPEQTGELVPFPKRRGRRWAGGWRQVSCINTLSGSGSPQGALGCSSRSALSSHNPHDKYWCDSCI